MKSSKKALAFALAAAMVVTAVPVAPAEAASTAKLSAKSVTVAAGTAKKQSKTIKVTTPSTWKRVKVSAKSSATGTAKVSVSGKTVKVTAVKKGTAKVTVTVTAKKSGKKVSKKLTATAKVVNAGLKVTAPTEVVVGSETKLTAKVCPSVAKVTYKSSDDTIATVDENGTVKAVKAGDVTITATSDYGKTVEKKIAVKNYVLKDVKQTKIDTLEAVVEGKTSDIKASDFTIKNQTTKVDALVKSVSVDKTDATKITVETFVDMTNGNDIDITLDGVTKSIKATDGNVSSLTVDHVTIPYGAEQEINMVAKDANGVVLLSAPYNSP
ncbi:MAG: Ig-like domain-containing protein, partial [Agathobacter sp.]|nr:Ig-like domain-containing protein [Agathobacter sp.]